MKKFAITLYLFFLKSPQRFYNLFWFKIKKIQYKSFPIIEGKLFLKGKGSIIFGDNVKINSGRTANPIGGDQRTVLAVAKKAFLEIGDFAGISNAAIICQQKIKIGKYVKIGGGVKIYDTDFHSINYKDRMEVKMDIPKTASIYIQDYCFIGAHSIILKGVTIGEKSIIGAGSVVAKSVPANEVWAGNPARFIKKI